MKLKKNSLTLKIWTYLIIFSIFILAFLWFFQIIFIDSFYERSKTRELNNLVDNIKWEYNKDTLLDNINTLSIDSGICIELVSGNNYIYKSEYNKNCLDSSESLIYKNNFVLSNKTRQTYRLINSRFNNKTLIVALKLSDNLYTYSSISLEPLDSTVDILKNQLIIVTIVVLILSFIISFFISKKLSKPIIDISKQATNLSSGKVTKFNLGEDIDEINELVKTLNEVSIELNKTEELRRELMSNVGHDLKTPLTMIKAYAEMVRDLTYKNAKKRNENLNTIIDESEKLNMLVNDIIELSKIQANTIPLKYERFDLTVLIKEVIKRFTLFTNQGYSFIFESESKYVIADRKRIEQVIYNLLNNAINYTGDDLKIYIDIKDDDEWYIVSIKDSGKGIDTKDLPYIFDRYFKVDKTHSRQKVGTGIGLSIVKSILDNHNLKYGVISKKGEGSTFYFKIKRD